MTTAATLLKTYRVACTERRFMRYCGWAGYRQLPAQARNRWEDGSLRLAPCPRCGAEVKPLSPKAER